MEKEITDTGTAAIEIAIMALENGNANSSAIISLIRALAAERDKPKKYAIPVRHEWKYINAAKEEDRPPKDGTKMLLYGAVNYDERSCFPDEKWERDFLIGCWLDDEYPAGWHSANTHMELIRPFLWCPIPDTRKTP